MALTGEFHVVLEDDGSFCVTMCWIWYFWRTKKLGHWCSYNMMKHGLLPTRYT